MYFPQYVRKIISTNCGSCFYGPARTGGSKRCAPRSAPLLLGDAGCAPTSVPFGDEIGIMITLGFLYALNQTRGIERENVRVLPVLERPGGHWAGRICSEVPG